MPTFDFQCKACGNVFEFARAFGSKTSPACPSCGAKKTEKLLSPPAVHFKGAGWYKTEGRAKSSTNKPPQKKDAAPTTEPTAPKTADPPAAASDTKTPTPPKTP